MTKESSVRSEEILLNRIHLRDSEPVDDEGEGEAATFAGKRLE